MILFLLPLRDAVWLLEKVYSSWLPLAILKTHSKNTWVKLDPERVHWGQTPFRVNDDPEISQPDAEYDPELGQSDPIICQIRRKLTDFRVILDPEWSLAPMDPFRVKFDPGVFRADRRIIHEKKEI